jgi:uncharacterized protein (TIGR00730 family)
MAIRSVCVFCGSSAGNVEDFTNAARGFGRALAERRLELVYGGGGVGLMGILADAALAAGGRVRGVIPHWLAAREVAHAGLTELSIVESMHARKARMAELADAFVALPGGLGTFDELFEIATWSQLGLHAKPVGVLEVADYFDPFREMLERAVSFGFVRPEHAAMFQFDRDPERLLDVLASKDDSCASPSKSISAR